MAKIWAIMSGGDWADAGVGFVILEGNVEGQIEELIASWKEYDKRRWGIIRINALDGTTHSVPEYVNLQDWLEQSGGRKPTIDELEEVWDE